MPRDRPIITQPCSDGATSRHLSVQRVGNVSPTYAPPINARWVLGGRVTTDFSLGNRISVLDQSPAPAGAPHRAAC